MTLIDLLQPFYWEVFTGLMAVYFLLRRRCIFLAMMAVCCAGWDLARWFLQQGEGYNIRPDLLLLLAVMLMLGAGSVVLAMTGLLIGGRDGCGRDWGKARVDEQGSGLLMGRRGWRGL